MDSPCRRYRYTLFNLRKLHISWSFFKSTKCYNRAMNKQGKDIETKERTGRYLIVGISIAVFNYTLYAVLANLIIKNNDLIWLSTFIATGATTILAYILHSKITWKERPITKSAKYKFFIWNIILTVAIGPLFTQLFSYITPLYDLAFGIISFLHIPFSYDFVLTTGAFVLTSVVVMLLNFFFYDRFVFGKTK